MQIIPHLVVNDGEAALAFYEKAFGATTQFKMPAKDGKRLMHASMNLDGGILMLVDDFPEMSAEGFARSPTRIGGTSVTIHLEVPDVDAAFERALKGGAKQLMKPANMFWGQRYGQLQDPFGHTWSMGGPHKPGEEVVQAGV